MRAARRIALAFAAVMAVAAASATATPMLVMYASPATNQAIIRPGTAGALPLDGRLFVQEPNAGHLFGGDADRPYRLSGVSGTALLGAGSAQAMANLLKAAVDANDCGFVPWGYAGCRSHLVFVDEIDYRFAEKGPNLNTPAWAGRTHRAGAPRKFPSYVPRPRPGHPGYELGRAMQILAGLPYHAGGTYAERVHFYIAPGVVTSIGVGRGKYQNLGRDRRPHFRSHEGLRGALQLSGGVWLEMYHFDTATRTRSPFNTYEWSVYPWRFSLYMTAAGATAPDPAVTAKIHFLMTRGMPKSKGGAPADCADPATPQGCQFALASSTKNQAILANGVGQYKMDGNEAEWRAHVKALFFPELP